MSNKNKQKQIKTDRNKKVLIKYTKLWDGIENSVKK